MSLLNPLGILGLLSLPVIVGLHLRMERNRRALVSSMHLWSFLDEKFQGSKPRFLELSWLLVLDLLIASTLSLALAQPQIELGISLGADTQVVILLDTSTSMLATDVEPSRFAAAKEDLDNILGSLDRNESAAVIAVNREAKLVGDTAQMPIEELKAKTEGLAAGGSMTDIRQALAKIETIRDEERPLIVHIFTDGAFPLEGFDDFPYQLEWHFYGDAGNNQAITGISLYEKTTGQYQVFVEVMNASKLVRTRGIRIFADGVLVDHGEVTIESGETVPYILTLVGDIEYVSADLLGSDLVSEDDFAGAGITDQSEVSVALVADQPTPLDRAILAVPHVVLEIIPPDAYQTTMVYDVTIFRGFLPETLPTGIVAVFDPPAEADQLSIGGTYTINTPLEMFPNPITDSVDFSGVRWDRAWVVLNSQLPISPLVTADAMPLLLEAEIPEGTLFVFLPVLELGGLTIHPAFPLMVANLLELGRDFTPEQNYHIDDRVIFPVGEFAGSVTLTGPAGIDVPLEGNEGVVFPFFGQYSMTRLDYLGGASTVFFGVNAGDRSEAQIRPREWIEDQKGEETETIKPPDLVIDLAPWLLSVAVILLLVEAWRAWR
jgi:Ca-activated chloride channel family protein